MSTNKKAPRHVGAQQYADFSRWRASNDKHALPFKQQICEFFKVDIEDEQKFGDILDEYMKRWDEYAELRMSQSGGETDLDKVLRMNFNQESTVTRMRDVEMQLSSRHTYGMGRDKNVHLYLEVLPAELTAHYAPPAISEINHYSNAVSTPFIYAKHHLGKRHGSDDVAQPPQSGGSFGPLKQTKWMRFEADPNAAGNAQSPNLYKSKLVHIGIINAEEHTKDRGINTQQTPYAAVGQVGDNGFISGIYAIPLDLKDDEEENEMSPSRWYDLNDLWKPDTVGVYYLGKTLEECRNNKWELVSDGPIEVIHKPEDE
ncbi:uncharacterized protein J4E78_010622 [Alternaria triticimaculans]|uniref:uncharacterized protein n=1 Tax=Alternaria triticimaculans TaxID=297637 RepID=UPI0020C51A84|nr:uncharacterized protein J4E78_010622 [Alternaria triticimaculans]KAI4640498.1 hypothetical protein J4E78_010622 [Alternaria triticimaculans]